LSLLRRAHGHRPYLRTWLRAAALVHTIVPARQLMTTTLVPPAHITPPGRDRYPAGNGVTNIEPLIGGKWLQSLKEAAPTLAHAAMLVNPDTQPDRGKIFLRPFAAAAGVLGVKPLNGEVHDLPGIEAVMSELAAMPGGGAVVISDSFFASHSEQIFNPAARLQLPIVYPYRYYVAQGGLMSYGVNKCRSVPPSGALCRSHLERHGSG
jgi:hypothetical protein